MLFLQATALDSLRMLLPCCCASGVFVSGCLAFGGIGYAVWRSQTPTAPSGPGSSPTRPSPPRGMPQQPEETLPPPYEPWAQRRPPDERNED